MQLGTFSMSLTVKDLKASRTFYEALGFKVIDGDESQNWLMLENGGTKIGLFHGMFPSNVMSFNPTDVRGIQNQLKAKGISFTMEADETTSGPAHATLIDPDGNAILLDQF